MGSEEEIEIPKIPERPKKQFGSEAVQPVPALPTKRPIRTRTTGALHQVPNIPLTRPQRRHTENQLHTVMQETQDQLEQMKTMISKPAGRKDHSSMQEESVPSTPSGSPVGSLITAVGQNEHNKVRDDEEATSSASPDGTPSTVDEGDVEESNSDISGVNEQNFENELETSLAEGKSWHSAQDLNKSHTEEPIDDPSEDKMSEINLEPSNKGIEKNATVTEKSATILPKELSATTDVKKECLRAAKPNELPAEEYCNEDLKGAISGLERRTSKPDLETNEIQDAKSLESGIGSSGNVNEVPKQNAKHPMDSYQNLEQSAATTSAEKEAIRALESQSSGTSQASLAKHKSETDTSIQSSTQETAQAPTVYEELGSEAERSKSHAQAYKNQTDEKEMSGEIIKENPENAIDDASSPSKEYGTPSFAGKPEEGSENLKAPAKDGEPVDSEKKKKNGGTPIEGRPLQSLEGDAPQVPQRPNKRPPPKKPSSKIAAFQAMLKQQQLMDASKTKDKQIDSGNSLLSGKRANITNNLNGIFGLPGMAPGMTPGMVPPQRPPARQQTGSDGDSQSSENQTSSQSAAPSGPQRRARGPKGRKLPAHIANVEKVETSIKTNEIQVLKTWSLKFQKISPTCSEKDSEPLKDIPESGVVSPSNLKSMSELNGVPVESDVICERETDILQNSKNEMNDLEDTNEDNAKEPRQFSIPTHFDLGESDANQEESS